MPPDDQMDLTEDSRDPLPQVIRDDWLPAETESVLFLFQQFRRYPPFPSHYILPSNIQSVLHQDVIHGFDYQSLLRIRPPALPSVSKAYQDAIKNSKFPIHSVTLIPCDGNLITVPAWIFLYWTEIERVVHTRRRWKVVLTWISNYFTSPPATQLCHRLLLGLSSLSWSYGVAYTSDITPLFSNSSTESWLTSFHIDHANALTKAQYQELHGPDATNHHIFATVDHFNAIIRFYGNVHAKKEGYLWDMLKGVENRVVVGEVDSLGGAMHLPSHWVSVVINFQQQQILYGDSLGNQIPDREHRALKRWIKHLVNRSTIFSTHDMITLDKLPTGYQDDSASCGLFALNAIAHHYLQHPLLPSDPIMLVCYRMEIGLNIISSMTVCLFHIQYKVLSLSEYYRL